MQSYSLAANWSRIDTCKLETAAPFSRPDEPGGLLPTHGILWGVLGLYTDLPGP